ncbi:MAG TPA: archease [Thermoanaerobaculia bacterium]|nr:archease [Thermoanaerobaculia bacterium]
MIELVPHTADVRMRISGSSLEELFSEGARGLFEVLAPRALAERAQRRIEVEANDTTSLLVDFLNEVLWNALVSREAYESVHFEELTEKRLVAELHGHLVEGFGDDVKAVTYHEAEVRRSNGLWETLLVLDV